MWMNTDNDRFALEMELLCLLPPEPASAPLDLLCLDMGMDKHEDLRALADDIRAMGIRVGTKRTAYGNAMFLHSSTWAKAKKKAESYWNQVYA